jgi:hypothetical protein
MTRRLGGGLAGALVVAALAPSACRSAEGPKYAAAAITAGMAVAAAAINRAATNECLGSCPPSTVCDRLHGVCVPIGELAPAPQDGVRWYACDPERFRCNPDDWLVCDERGCQWLSCDETADFCEPRPHEPCPVGDADCTEPPMASEPAASRPPADPCRGLCLKGERCVAEAGATRCEVQAAASGQTPSGQTPPGPSGAEETAPEGTRAAPGDGPPSAPAKPAPSVDRDQPATGSP